MDFAKNLMKKYGWEEGKGLGKNSEGIVKPIKASFKFDNSGLGVNKAEEFNNHWWKRVFNEASSNININKNDEGNISFSAIDYEGVEISTKDYSVKKLKRLNGNQKHRNFLKTSVLNGSGYQDTLEKIDTDSVKFKEYRVLNDEELFAACNGRTVHKGARHGINMKGKLGRIEEQEKELILKMSTYPQCNDDSWNLVKNKKRKSEFKNEKKTNENNDELTNILHTTNYFSKSKKKRKIQKKIAEELAWSMISTKLKESENDEAKKSKRKNEQCLENPIENKFKNLKSEDEGDNSADDGTDIVEETASIKRTDKVHRRKSKKSKEDYKNTEIVDKKSKSISKCNEYKEKRKLKKSLKKMHKKLQSSLSIT